MISPEYDQAIVVTSLIVIFMIVGAYIVDMIW